jgi:type 1 glutamine amidotransferase
MQNPVRLILLTDSRGFVHEVVQPDGSGVTHVQRVFDQIAARTGRFIVETIADAAELTRDRLARADVVALYTSGDIPLDVAMLDEWIRGGGGLLGVHAATTTRKTDPAFTDIFGGIFNGHAWGADARVTLKVHEPEHSVVAMFPTSYDLMEEMYQHHSFDAASVRVLMSLDMQRTAIKRPEHVPVVWCKQRGKGRVLYTSLGHHDDVWASQVFREHIVAAVEWLTGKGTGSAEPNPALHAMEQRLAEQACEAAAGK